MKNIIKIAAVQDSPVFLNKNATIDKICELIKIAAAKGAKFILFPEAFISAYPDWVWLLPPSKKDQINFLYSKLFENAISIEDPSLKIICDAAKKESVNVIIGVNERNSESSNASLYNSMLYISDDGKLLGIHRKLIPTGGERLMWAQGDGSTLYSFDTPFGKVGGLICWENYMPLARYHMYMQGVKIYFAPTWDSSESWTTAMKHIAREGGMFVVSCAQAIKKSEIDDSFEFKELYPEDREWINKGNSCITNPKGQFIVEPLAAQKSILYADLDLSEINDQKWLFDSAGHYSRPDVFDYKLK